MSRCNFQIAAAEAANINLVPTANTPTCGGTRLVAIKLLLLIFNIVHPHTWIGGKPFVGIWANLKRLAQVENAAALLCV